MSGMA